MKRVLWVALATLAAMAWAQVPEKVSPEVAAQKGCLSCHEGIEDIVPPDSGMMAQIKAFGAMAGDPAGCVVCHGGNPQGLTKEEAHSGAPEALSNRGPQTFYPDPGSIWIADRTCGQCHPGYDYRLNLSLMQTEAGKIQGNLHTWGFPETWDGKTPYGNYDVKDTDGPVPQVGTEAYKKYMAELIEMYPQAFPSELKQIPEATPEEVKADPKLAALTYQRHDCQRCHVGVNGREKRGDYRGMGCSSCHVLYGDEGFYEGNDPTIKKDERGHPLKHRIVGTREFGGIHEDSSGGIPIATCNSCHNRGKRIGVTFQGLMEFPYGTPFNDKGGTQPKLHTKKYLFIADDVHHRGQPGKGGMLCQDCHTTIDMHGDGNIFATTLAQVEIECEDCHGTPDKFPWELPLGQGEEFGRDIGDTPRGLADAPLPETAAFATLYPKEDGYLLTARGNPFGNVVKKGDKVIVHSASGEDFEVPVLKAINQADAWVSQDAKVAMVSVAKHAENLECYACHASWVPQCYGCHVKVDYSGNSSGTDWIKSGSAVDEHGMTAESAIGSSGIKSPGKISESRSYLRWEDPVLGINGEGRVTPLMPGCQVVYTVIDTEGKTIAHNVIARSPDEAAQLGQDLVPLAIDMAPAQPHSTLPEARKCESCHDNPKALGYGIDGGIYQNRYAEDIIADLTDPRTGEPLAKNYQVQIPAIPDLTFDWSRIVDPKTGEQVATVGTHWPLSRSLPADMRETMNRTGLCMGCHQEMPNKDIWSVVSTPGTLTNAEHLDLMHQMLLKYYEDAKRKGQ
ncbi:cytochrome C [Oceanithermus sp.]